MRVQDGERGWEGGWGLLELTYPWLKSPYSGELLRVLDIREGCVRLATEDISLSTVNGGVGKVGSLEAR